MYHEYYTIIGGNTNVNQECFKFDNTEYNSSSKNLMISAYSFYGINLTLYNENEGISEGILETKIIANWNYIIINPLITKLICFYPLSSNSLSGVFFQLIDYNTIEQNQAQITQIIRGVPLLFYFPPNLLSNFIYHPFDTLYLEDSSKYIINVKFIKGTPKLYLSYCDEYPFNCEIGENNITKNSAHYYQLNTTSEGVKYELNKSHFDIKTFSPSKKYLIIINCENTNNEGCEYQIKTQRPNDLSLFESSSGKNFIKISDSILVGESKNYLFFINNGMEIKYISVILYSLSGNGDLSITKDSKEIGDYNALINKEYVNIIGETNDINGLYNININAIESTHFVLYYQIYKSENEVNYIPSGQMEEQFITFSEKIKSFTILNPYVNNQKTFLINLDSLNCQLKATFNNIEYSNSKQVQIYIESTEEIYNSGEYEISIELLSFDTGRTSQTEKCIFYLGGFEINEDNPISLIEGINYSFEISSNIKSLSFNYKFKMYERDNENREDISILFDKNGPGNLLVTAKNINGQKEFYISDSYTFNTLFLPYFFFTKNVSYYNTTTYNLDIIVKYFNEGETKQIPFDI